ncbi:hypothetical protein KY348_00660, partial [Candidatus Woesearchaeota archaeon]|nr:hypothetical protein [Candidatus Woesearchaeota archaeon]
SFISFVKKGNNKIRFLIQDYITNLGLCRKKGLHVNGTICPIKWAKKFRVDNITSKRKDISVEMTRFDIEQKNTSAEAYIQGRIKGNLTNPLLEVRVYSYAEGNPTRLKKRELIELTPKGDYYVFNIKVIMLTPRLSIGYLSPDEEEEFVEQTKEKQDSNIILLLFQDQNYFYAQERIIQEGEITEKIYK